MKRSLSPSDTIFVTEVIKASTEDFSIRGALIASGNNCAEIHGLVEIRNGERYHFHLPEAPYAIAQNKMAMVCLKAAKSYQAEISTFRYHGRIRLDALYLLLCSTRGGEH